ARPSAGRRNPRNPTSSGQGPAPGPSSRRPTAARCLASSGTWLPAPLHGDRRIATARSIGSLPGRIPTTIFFGRRQAEPGDGGASVASASPAPTEFFHHRGTEITEEYRKNWNSSSSVDSVPLW